MLANLQISNLFVCLSTSFEKSYRGPYSFWKALDLKKVTSRVVVWHETLRLLHPHIELLRLPTFTLSTQPAILMDLWFYYYVFPVILEYWKPVELYYSSVQKWVAKVVLGLQPKEEVRLRQNFKDQDQLQLVYPHCLEVSTNYFFKHLIPPINSWI